MNRLFLLLSFLLISLKGVCCPAYPYRVSVSCADGNTEVFLYGDEHSKWGETIDGYTVIQNQNDQWCYAVVDHESGFLTPSAFSLVNREQYNEDYMKFLINTPKHLRPQSSLHRTEGLFQIGKAIGERRILVILMDFTDLRFSKTQQDFERLFNQKNYNEDGAQGSVKDYYMSVSYGQLSLICDVFGPYTASHPMSYYGSNSISGSDHQG